MGRRVPRVHHKLPVVAAAGSDRRHGRGSVGGARRTRRQGRDRPGAADGALRVHHAEIHPQAPVGAGGHPALSPGPGSDAVVGGRIPRRRGAGPGALHHRCDVPGFRPDPGPGANPVLVPGVRSRHHSHSRHGFLLHASDDAPDENRLGNPQGAPLRRGTHPDYPHAGNFIAAPVWALGPPSGCPFQGDCSPTCSMAVSPI